MNSKQTILACLLALCLGTGSAFADRVAPVYGVSAGDVQTDSAIIWSRGNAEGVMHVVVWEQQSNRVVARQQVAVASDNDYSGKAAIRALRPNTAYGYRVWFDQEGTSNEGSKYAEGVFRTAPQASDAAPVRFAFGGDVAGQNVCRDQVDGFPIFNAINQANPDFFIGLGDMIYADGVCDPVGKYGNAQVPGDFVQSADLQNYWAHWKYNRSDAGLKAMLAKIPYYAIWDDHEVVNDFGPLHDTRTEAPYTAGVHLLPIGLQAFLNYNPIAENADTPKRLYRTVRWGKNVELFILDTRQYRDANFAADSSTEPKTMLGREQVAWLKNKLKLSDATWKIIVSSVPMSIPTGSSGTTGRDGWANYQETGGFEYELLDILQFMKDNGMYNQLWITTDVHFGEVFRYTPFADDPSFQVHELVSGPANAGLFPNRTYDVTMNTETLFFYGPNSSADVTTWEQAKPWMNFGAVEVSENGELKFSLRKVDGAIVYENTLLPK